MTASVSGAGTSQAFQEAELVRAPKSPPPLCESCRKISNEHLSEGKGYTHSWLEVLQKTAKWCRLCQNFSYLISARGVRWDRIEDRPQKYRMVLSLHLGGRHRKARPDHCHNDEFAFKCILVEVIDTRPWPPLARNDRGGLLMIQNSKGGWEVSNQRVQEVSELKTWMLCHTQEGDPAVAFGLPWLRNVECTGSARSIEVAHGWLKQCLATDDKDFTKRFANRDALSLDDEYDVEDFGPATPFPAERPARLLKVVPSANDADKLYGYSVKLFETNGCEYKYAALSYCWGKMTLAPITHTWLTQRITVEQHLEGIDLGCLPATIRDCIRVAFSLGIYYVWVDSLCMIQDDSSDWGAESAKMGGIYRGALLTIAASRSGSSSSGIFNWKKSPSYLDPFDESLCIENFLRSGGRSCLYFEHFSQKWELSPNRNLFRREVYRSPLSQRAWVYQEQMLYRRTLYFAESQLYWECNHCRLSQDNSRQEQSMQETYSIQNFQKPLTADLFVRQWYCGAVETYTKRALTCPEDRLIAISAVAKATYMNRHVRYVAGLWEDCILAGLCWYRDSRGEKDYASSCPSWPWASQLSSVSYREIDSWYYGAEVRNCGKDADEELSFRNKVLDPYLYLAKVLNIQVESSEENPFGHVQNGHIVLRTWATPGKVRRDRFGDCNVHFEDYSGDGERTLVILEKNVENIRTGRAVLDDDGREDQDVVIAMVIGWNTSHAHWLVLLLDTADANKQGYTRIGLGIMEDDQGKPDFERNWTKLDITIV